jgi:large repetitive protein
MADAQPETVSNEGHLDLAEGIRSVQSGDLEAKLNQGVDPNAEYAAQGSLSGNVAFRNAGVAGGNGLDGLGGVVGLADLANIGLISGQGANGATAAQNFAAALLAGTTINLSAATQQVAPSGIGGAPQLFGFGPGLVANGNGAGTGSAAEPSNATLAALFLNVLLPVPDVRAPVGAQTNASDTNTPATPDTAPANGVPTNGDGGGGNGVVYDGDAAPPTLSVSGTASGNEGTPIPLVIQAALTDTDGSETLSIRIDNLPAGSVLSAGQLNADGSWTLTANQLPGLTVTPPQGFSGTIAIDVTATSHEGALTNSISQPIGLTVIGVAIPPNLAVTDAIGAEDSAIPLAISASLNDTDGSETLSLKITGVPTGAVLNHGTLNPDGSWTLAAGDLAGLAMTPPHGYSGTLHLDVTATSAENGTTSSVDHALAVTVTAVASTPTLSVANASGTEDMAIPLAIAAALTDTDGSETLSLTVTGVPTGASLSHGILNADGSWTLAPGDLAGLSLTPPSHFSGAIHLSVTATSAENGTTASISHTLDVSVTGVATPPQLAVSAASGPEGTTIPLNISAALNDTDGSETLSLTITGVPTGALLNHGTLNADGSWTLAPADLSGLTLTPVHGFSGALTLAVTATSAEAGTTSSVTQTLGVMVNGFADPPDLTVSSASGPENTVIPLVIHAALTDTDGSETLTISIAGVPAGSVLSAGSPNVDGTWSLTPAELAGLTLTPPTGFSGTIHLDVTATSAEGGTTSSVARGLDVTIDPVATPPNLTVGAATGAEDTAIPLHIVVQSTDPDGSETVTVLITGAAAGSVLSAGHQNPDGSWTLTPAELIGLTMTPPPGFSGTIQLDVIATTSEGASTASTDHALNVTVTGVATPPSLSVAAASGNEDAAIPLSITASLNDTDGSETLSLTVTGLPAGATLNHGTRNPDGSWILGPGDLAGLTVTPPHGFSGTMQLDVTATSAENGTTASVDHILAVTVAAVASPPNLSVSAASGSEDTAIPLTIAASLSDTDGSEALSLTVTGVPSGAALNHGTLNADGSWTLAPGDLAGLTLTPPHGFSGTIALDVAATSSESGTTSTVDHALNVTVIGVASTPSLTVSAASGPEGTPIPLTINAALTDNDGSETLSITVTGMPMGATLNHGTHNPDGSWTLAPGDLAGLVLTPPLGFSGTIPLDVTATSSENGTTASIDHMLNVAVSAVASTPNLAVGAASGNEDTAIPLSITASSSDPDGSETLTLSITGVPTGATLNHGTHNPDGSWSLAPGDLSGLTLTPPHGFSGTIALDVQATSAENGTTASVDHTLNVTVAGVASAPDLTVSAASGAENTAIPLTINAALTDTDGSETLSITVAGMPAGATLNHGTRNADGSWTLAPGDLTGLTVTGANGYSGTMHLNVTATSAENGTTASTNHGLDVTVTGVATAPNLTVGAASGTEDTPIPLSITASSTDPDGSDTLGLTITGVPAGAMLNHGLRNPDGSWTLSTGDLTGLTLTPPHGYSGTIHLDVTATSAEDGTTASIDHTMDVTVAGVASTPDLSVTAANGVEGATIPLTISASLTDTDGSETLSLTITGIPTGAVLNHGTLNADGSWTLAPGDLGGLAITPVAGYSGTMHLDVTATSSENGTTASVDHVLDVTVTGVATAPNLSVSAASGNEDTAIPLTIAVSSTDPDGSDTLSITITGVPAGAALNHGTRNPDGSWTLATADLTGLTVTPPHGYSGTMHLDVTATSAEDGTTASVDHTLDVAVAGVASTPNLSVTAASGNEDTAIPLSITASLSDTDGSETLSLAITGIPAGAVLNHGTLNADGSWTLAPGDLSGLTVTPPHGFSGTMHLDVFATSSENGTTASVDHTLDVVVAGMASTPTLSVGAASGLEDSAIPLTITAALTDNDGSETLGIIITGVPTGAVLNHGTQNPDGSWTLAPGDLSGLTITPPHGFSGTMALDVKATSSENGTTASIDRPLNVAVAGVASTPNLTVSDSSGLEHTPIALSINASLSDTDGSEALSLNVTGVPAGATLNHGTLNADGSWTLTSGDLTGLTMTPPYGFSGTIQLDVTATSSENGTSASIDHTLNVAVAGVASPPILSVSAVSGPEDSAIPLTIAASLSDTDGSETLSITVAGAPTGSVLNHGTLNADGSWTLAPGDLAGLTITPPSGFTGPIQLDVTATSSENGTTSSIDHTLDVDVSAVAGAPILSTGAVTGAEDTAIALSISASIPNPTGSEVLSFAITGVPAGATLNHGTLNPDASWTLAPGDLAGLTITPPHNYSGTIQLDVAATSTLNGTSATADHALAVTVTGVADAPSLSVTPAAGTEDTPIALTIGASLNDSDGSETLSVTVSGMPTGATLNHGTRNPDGSWTLAPGDLSSLAVTPPPGYSGTMHLTVTATAGEAGTTASTSHTLDVGVTGVASTPNLSVSAASGNEGTPIPLTINASLSDTDGSETLALTITGIPTGASLNHGTHNPDGSWTLAPGDLAGLTITPAPGYSGTLHLDVTATSSENGTTSSVDHILDVTVAGVASTPTLSVSPASGLENAAIPLSITAGLTDADGSETLGLTITGAPAGSVLNHGTHNPDGSWTLAPGDLAGLTITPPSGYSGTIHLDVTATSSENGTTASLDHVLDVTVAGVASTPTLSVSAASGLENAAIPLSITAGLTDTDGSETLGITITGAPAGSVFNHGTHNPDGSWSLTPGQLAGLTITPPSGYSGTMHLDVTATSSENGTTASLDHNLDVTVAGVASTPNLSVSGASGNEGTAIPLTINASLSDTDGSETLSLAITGIPTGATLNHGTRNPDGSWTLAPGDLAGLTITPPPGYSGTLHLDVTATSSENGTTSSVDHTLDVAVAGVASTPTLSVSAASGVENAAIPLSITAGLTDTDGSETLGITITGMPSGAILNHGTRKPDGSWSLAPGDLSGLTITPASGYSGTIHLDVTATSSENGTTASIDHTLDVTVAGVASTPNLSVSAAAGNEGTAIPLTISASLNDTDGSETLGITVTGVPTGASLNHGVRNSDGSWTLAPGDLAGLTVTPPPGYSGTLHLDVTATSSENGTTASVDHTVDVVVTGVASTPSLTVSNTTGAEDTAIGLTVNAALTDTDGSETLAIKVTGVPTGATLNHGTLNGDGSYSLTQAQLAGLSITPPSNYSGVIHLTVAATSSENGTTATASHALDVTVTGVADTPTLMVTGTTGDENTAIPLIINAALTDTDGSESLSVNITGLPVGATLSAGTHNSDGSWTVPGASLATLTMTPPANYTGILTLHVVATSAEAGTTATSPSKDMEVVVFGVANTPNLTVNAATGVEDTAIALTIAPALTDATETLSMTISGVPSGALLSAGSYIGNGTWSLTPGQLTGLTIMPPANFAGTMNLSVTAISTEPDGDAATRTSPLTVTVTPVADAPTLTVKAAAGNEDTAISLNIAAALTDTDGSESLAIKITGVPSGATLSAGTHNSDGSWTLTSAQLSNLKLTPAANSDANLSLTVAATSTDSNGSTATSTANLAVTVTAVADAPSTVTAGNAVGTAGIAIPIAISGGASTDTDGSESVTYVIHGVPDGFAFNHGSNNGDNTWTMTASELSGLTLMSPDRINAQLNLSVNAVSHDNDNSVAVGAATNFNVKIGNWSTGYLIDLTADLNIGGIGAGVHVGLLPDIDLFPASGGLLQTGGIYMKEDTWQQISDSQGLLALPVLSTVLSLINYISFSGIPAGTQFSAGTNFGGGVWGFTSAQLNNLSMKAPPDSSTDFTIVVTANLLLGLLPITLTSTTVHVEAIADTPTLAVTAGAATEDHSFALNITGALTDTDGSETLSYMVSGLPAGFALNHGVDNGNGTWTVHTSDVSGLTVTPSADYSGHVDIKVSAVSTESEGDSAVVQKTVGVDIAAIADSPNVSPVAATGTEDHAIGLNLGISLKDTDGSESISSITISGLPSGASLTNATDNHNGTWSVAPAQAGNVQFVPPNHWSGDAALTVTAQSTESSNGSTASSSSTLNVHVNAVAETPNLTVSDSSGDTGQPFALHIASSLVDTDGSEHLSVVVSGMPDGFTISNAQNDGHGDWTLDASHLSSATITAPAGTTGDFNLTVTAYAVEQSNDNTAQSQAHMTVHVSDLDHAFVSH